MTNPTPQLLFSMANLTAEDISTLDANYDGVVNRVPDDLMTAFTTASHALDANVKVSILSGGTQWLVEDGSSYYEMRVNGTSLDVYSITSAVYGVLSAKAKTASGVTSIRIITLACHAIVNTQLPVPDTKPAWFDTLTLHLDNAKKLANEWIDDLAPDLTASLPKKVVTYDTQYKAITKMIVQIAMDNPDASGMDDPHVHQVFELVNALKTQVGSIHDDLTAEDKKLLDWGKRMQTAHDDLTTGVASIQSSIADLKGDIGKKNADIDRLNGLIEGQRKAITAAAIAVGAGIFTILVGIVVGIATLGAGLVVAGAGVVAVVGGAATWGVMQHKINQEYDDIANDNKAIDNDNRQIVALGGLNMATTGAVSSISAATAALSDVRAMWKLFEGELEGVITQLNTANASLSLIVNAAFVNGAADEWELAAQLATQLLAPAVNGESPALIGLKPGSPLDVNVPAAA